MAEQPTPNATPDQALPTENAASTPSSANGGTGSGSTADYWQANIRILMILLAIWFTVSFGFGILLADVLNQVRILGSGFKLGFWFAQQGSIYTFVVLIFVYVVLMNRLDRRYGVQED